MTSPESGCFHEVFPLETDILSDQLVFLLGPHRSGTTYLHQVLADTGAFDYISYYDIAEFPRLLSNHESGLSAESIRRLQQEIDHFGETRGFDQVPIGPLQAEEYGYLLSRSPFNIHNLDPISNTDFEPLKSLCSIKRRISSYSKPLLLKNPNDFYDGFVRISQTFPLCRFIFIHRHPLHVFNSQIRVWRNLLEKRNPWFAKIDNTYAKIQDNPTMLMASKISILSGRGLLRVMDTLCKAYSFYLEQHSLLRNRSVSVRYEDLCMAPFETLHRIEDKLKLTLPFGLLKTRPSPRETPILPEVESVYLENAYRLYPYLEHLNYSLPPVEKNHHRGSDA